MVHHIVLFSFASYPEGMSKQEFMNQAKASFEELPRLIEPLKSLKVSFNINGAEEYDLMLHGELERFEEVEVYAKHPEHVARVQQWIKPYVAKRACVDIEQ